MEHLAALNAVGHSCSLCADRKKERNVWELLRSKDTCHRAHFLSACVQAVQPLMQNAGRASKVMEEDGIIRIKLTNYTPKDGKSYPYGCDHKLEFECLVLDAPTSMRKPVLCAEVRTPGVNKKTSMV